RYRYTGKERDSESGLEYHSARYYLPWLARWLKPDPAGLRDGVNVFVYAKQNPLRYTDPSGLGSDGCSSSCDEDAQPNSNPDGQGPSDVVIVIYRGGIDGDAVDLDPEHSGTAGQLAIELEDHVTSQGRTVATTILAPGITSTDAVEAGLEFIESHSDADTTIIVYGYSRGGDAAVDLTDELDDQNREVDLLFTVDAAYGPLSVVPMVSPIDRTIPENVEVNINYYQTEPSRIRSRGDANTPSERGTDVYNIEVEDTSHGAIDEDVQQRVIGHAESFLDADNANTTWTPQGISRHKYQHPKTIREAIQGTPLSPTYSPSHLGWEADVILWLQNGMMR
ncbi:MAG: RHS repeat-associated core domain-containing protein, partial [Cytophagales bacterium]|nr:RHS repeat-associated core domain-containing protein [Cytophagales bacterium]